MYSVLYVDDEETLLEIAKLFLERTGEFSVETSPSATGAQELLTTRRFDAIISDYQMPGMDGIEFLKNVRTQYGDLPFILFTGKGREEVVIQAINNGADFYIQKGGEPKAQFAELAHKIRQAVKRKRAEELLLTSEERYREFFYNAPLGIFRSTPGGKIIDVNPQFAQILGYTSPEEIKKVVNSRTVDEILFAEPTYRSQFVQHVLETGGWHVFENKYRRKDGRIITANLAFRSVTNPATGATELEGFIEDITERKYAEEQLQSQFNALRTSHDLLRQSEARLRRAEEAAQVGHWEIDTDAGTITASPGAMAIYGLDGVLSLPAVQELPLPEYRADLDTALRALTSQARPYNMEFKIRRPNDGTIREIQSIAEYDSVRHVIFGVIVDITSRRRVEIELRAAYEQIAAADKELRNHVTALEESQRLLKESEANYRTILENIQDVYYRSDKEGILVMISPSGAALLGYDSADDMIGRPGTDFYADPQKREILLARLKIDRSVSEIETALKRRDGTIVIVSTSSHMIFDAEGRYAGVEGIFRDITRRKRAEDLLNEEEELLRATLESTTAGILVVDEHQHVTHYNARFAEMWSLPHDVVERRDDEQLLSFVLAQLTDPEQFLKKVRDLYTSSAHDKDFIEFRDGRVFERISLPLMQGGRVTGRVWNFHDITEQRRSEEALRLNNKKLNLLSSITRHDIRNQILAIRSYIQLSQDYTGEPEMIADFIRKEQTVADEIDRQIMFTEDYEKIGIKKPVWQDLGEPIERASVYLPPGAVRVEDEVGGIALFADPLFGKVLYNLVDNAIRYGGDRMSIIRISCRPSETGLAIIFEDNGTGIPGEEKTLIFERGYGKNPGLGLFLSREILLLTGISIAETGVPGKGARFEMIVPKGRYRINKIGTKSQEID